MSNNKALFDELSDMGIDVCSVIQESFLGYKYRKRNKILYYEDSNLPTMLIRLYYGFNPNEISFNNMKKRFITHYINNESKLEDVDYESIHGKQEVDGLRAMYEYIHSDEVEKDGFELFSICLLHKKLYSFAEHSECAGSFRNFPAFLPGTGTELCDSSYIVESMINLEDEVNYLLSISKEIKNNKNINELLDYLDRCVILHCKLVKIHPFGDGNGRTIRGFINKLLEDAGLPPIYIKVNERTEYHRAMNRANNEDDYSLIKQFYRYKVCDSIIELDINERLKNDPLTYTNKRKNQS